VDDAGLPVHPAVGAEALLAGRPVPLAAGGRLEELLLDEPDLGEPDLLRDGEQRAIALLHAEERERHPGREEEDDERAGADDQDRGRRDAVLLGSDPAVTGAVGAGGAVALCAGIGHGGRYLSESAR
jgi:hypothetical protein